MALTGKPGRCTFCKGRKSNETPHQIPARLGCHRSWTRRGQLKSQLLQAMVQIQLRKRTAERQRSLVNIGAVAVKTGVEAETALQEAEISFVTARQALANLGFEIPDQMETQDAKRVAEELRYLGISPSVASSLPIGNKTSNLIPVRAPYEGVLVE